MNINELMQIYQCDQKIYNTIFENSYYNESSGSIDIFGAIKQVILNIIDAILNFIGNVRKFFKDLFHRTGGSGERMFKEKANEKTESNGSTTTNPKVTLDNVCEYIDLKEFGIPETYSFFQPSKAIETLISNLFDNCFTNTVEQVYYDVSKGDINDKDKIYTKVFGRADHSTYSENNDFLYLYRQYFSRLFSTDINDIEKIHKELPFMLKKNSYENKYKSKDLLKDMVKNKLYVNGGMTTKLLKGTDNAIKDIILYLDNSFAKSEKQLEQIKNKCKNLQKDIPQELYVALERSISHFDKYIRLSKVKDIVLQYYKQEQSNLVDYTLNLHCAVNQTLVKYNLQK